MACHIMHHQQVGLAYQSIREFFDLSSIKTACDEVENVLIYAFENAVWKADNPSYVLFCMQQLEALSSAAFIIYYSRTEKDEVILESSSLDPEMKEKDFIDRWRYSTNWNNFPRNLTAKQYNNPYRAIRKFCKFMAEPEWKQVFAELTEFAISKDTIEETDISYNIFKVRIRLLQLIEACHLIFTRMYWKEKENSKKKKN